MNFKYINKKSTIYLVAPSFGCTTSPYYERLNKAIPRLEKLGHEVIVGDNCYKAVGKCASNTPKLRGKNLWKHTVVTLMLFFLLAVEK